jgi:hypothetical protein
MFYRLRDAQIEALKGEKAALENRVKVLMNMLSQYQHQDGPQQQQQTYRQQDVRHTTTTKTRGTTYIRSEVYPSRVNAANATTAGTSSSPSHRHPASQDAPGRTGGRLAWLVPGHPSDSKPSVPPRELERIAAEKRKEEEVRQSLDHLGRSYSFDVRYE